MVPVILLSVPFPAVAHVTQRAYGTVYPSLPIQSRSVYFLSLSRARRAEVNRQYQSRPNKTAGVLSVKRQVGRILNRAGYISLSFPLSNVSRIRTFDRLLSVGDEAAT